MSADEPQFKIHFSLIMCFWKFFIYHNFHRRLRLDRKPSGGWKPKAHRRIPRGKIRLGDIQDGGNYIKGPRC